jgi:ketosteroid isomerase-like protein
MEKASSAIALALTLLSAGIPTTASGDTTAEEVIRALDAREAEAMSEGDVAGLKQLWSPGFIVNAPDHRVKPREEVLKAVEESRIRYSAFQRTVERVVVRSDCAISMGGEIVTPVGDRADAGRKVSRRYTHIWRNSDGSWTLIARHANVIETPDE